MYEIIKSVINDGRYVLEDILVKIDTLWLQSSITDEQKQELVDLAREKADMSMSVNIMKKLEDLDKRVSALENKEPSEPSEEYPEYVVGKWYYKDDKITFEGEKYVCIAPQGQVYTWSPSDYPSYWEKV